jgi:hypothetical protein
MDRKKFISTCGFACVGGIGLAALLESCGSTKQLNGKIIGDDLVIPVTDFEQRRVRKFPIKICPCSERYFAISCLCFQV